MKEFCRRIVNVKTFCLEKVVAALALVEMLNGSEAKKQIFLQHLSFHRNPHLLVKLL